MGFFHTSLWNIKRGFFMNYKDVCGKKKSVWFTLSDMEEEGRLFLQWAKELGCVWRNGEEIYPERGTDFFTLSIRSDGTLANVPAMARISKQFKSVKRINFKDYYQTLKKGTSGVFKIKKQTF